MVFVGKIAYLVLFPGALFVLLAGLAARTVMAGVGTAIAGAERPGADHAWFLFQAAGKESVAADGSLRAVVWIAPLVKVLALSWVSCLALGFVKGDLVLLFALLVLASGTDVATAWLSGNPRVRQGAWPEAASLMAWAVPIGLALATLSLRTGEVTLSGLINWQAVNGVLIGASAGGGLAAAGTVLALLAALLAGTALARLRPLGRGYLSDAPAGILDDVSGPPLTFFMAAETAALFVVPLVLVALFFAGPAAHWYEIVFWGLKILGVFVLLALIDTVCARASSRGILLWGLGVAGLGALAGLILTWIGVSA